MYLISLHVFTSNRFITVRLIVTCHLSTLIQTGIVKVITFLIVM